MNKTPKQTIKVNEVQINTYLRVFVHICTYICMDFDRGAPGHSMDHRKQSINFNNRNPESKQIG